MLAWVYFLRDDGSFKFETEIESIPYGSENLNLKYSIKIQALVNMS